MTHRRMLILLGMLSIGILIVTTIPSDHRDDVKAAANISIPQPEPARQIIEDSTDVIDGAKHPEKIPDNVAYTMLFRLIANRETDEEKSRIRSYLKQALGCEDCNHKVEEADIESLISAAEEFNQQVSIVDQQAMDRLERYHPEHPPLSAYDKEPLRQFQKQKEAIVNDTVASLLKRLSVDGKASLHRHIKDRMKRRIKMNQKPA